MITSPTNDKLKLIRRLNARRRDRERAGLFVAEGEDLLAAADAAGWAPVERLVTAGSGLEGDEVEPALLAAVSGLGSGTRTLGVYEERWANQPAGPVCVYLHGLHDPGNVGTILRSAQAFGASSVALGPECADPYAPKAVRASMGAIFDVALARATSLEALPGATVALVPRHGPRLDELCGQNGSQTHFIRKEGISLLIGAEREGLPSAMVEGAHHVAHIPIRTDSLNAAMAATVALYEVSRMARA